MSAVVAASRVLVDGRASASVLHLAEPLSFWGGLDAETGAITDVHHPQRGATVTGCVLVMPSGRGSSSSSSVLAEAIRARTAPAAIVLAEADPIVALGAIVADELYGVAVPVVVVDDEDAFREVASFGSASIEGDTIREA
jgi:predicted aconitase with swiveling domain